MVTLRYSYSLINLCQSAILENLTEQGNSFIPKTYIVSSNISIIKA